MFLLATQQIILFSLDRKRRIESPLTTPSGCFAFRSQHSMRLHDYDFGSISVARENYPSVQARGNLPTRLYRMKARTKNDFIVNFPLSSVPQLLLCTLCTLRRRRNQIPANQVLRNGALPLGLFVKLLSLKFLYGNNNW